MQYRINEVLNGRKVCPMKEILKIIYLVSMRQQCSTIELITRDFRIRFYAILCIFETMLYIGIGAYIVKLDGHA